MLAFISSKIRSSAPHNPRIVLLGPTGSGKAVQAALLANKYNLINGQCPRLLLLCKYAKMNTVLHVHGYILLACIALCFKCRVSSCITVTLCPLVSQRHHVSSCITVSCVLLYHSAICPLVSQRHAISVSCGQLIKQAIADGTQQGLACKPYVEKGINGKQNVLHRIVHFIMLCCMACCFLHSTQYLSCTGALCC